MAGPLAAPDQDFLQPSLTDWLSRLVDELDILVATSVELQNCIHDLASGARCSETRKVLQSSDRLTQGLQCIRAAMDGLAGEQSYPDTDRSAAILKDVFLQDMRMRLVDDLERIAQSDRAEPGEVEYF